MNEDKIRLEQILRIVDKENRHLMDVHGRLFENNKPINEAVLEKLIESPEGSDRLESFSAKFSRMQDTIIDKLLPQWLKVSGEILGSAIDNLNRAERLNLLDNPQTWVAMRRLRNKLVHEYIDVLSEMVDALEQARIFTGELNKTYISIRKYSEKYL